MKIPMNVTIDENLVDRAKKKAKKQGRPLSNYINQIMKQDLKGNKKNEIVQPS